MAELHAVPAADNVPGVMRCDVCKFELTRVNLNVNVGTVTAGDLSPEPCPNGCGTLRPTTWKERANDAEKAAEGLFDRAFAAEKERDALRGLWLEWLDGMYDGPDLLRRVKLAVHGPLRKPGNAGVAVGRPVEPVDPCRPWCTCGAWPHKSWCGYRNPDAKEDQRGV